MGKINFTKVLVGGLIAGVVLNIVDGVLFGVVLQKQMAEAMASINRPPMTGAQMPWFVFLDFVAGIFLVWMYAAMRPRFGAGPASAAKTGVAAWVIGLLLPTLFMWPMHLYPTNMTILTLVVALIEWPIATVVGAKFYTAGAGVGAGMGAGAGARM